MSELNISGVHQTYIMGSYVPKDKQGIQISAPYHEYDGMRPTDVWNMPGPGTGDVTARAIEPVDVTQRIYNAKGALEHIVYKGQTIDVLA